MSSDPENRNLLSRREAILRVSAMLGGAALVGQTAMLAGCEANRQDVEPESPSNSLITSDDIALLDEIADTILPETSTPGAKAAGVGPFIAVMVADTYYEADQQIFLEGLRAFRARSHDSAGAPFEDLSAEQRLSLVEELDAEQFEYMQTRDYTAPTHYFRMLKELTLLGYFTSEIGYTQAMRYAESPGKYEPCVPYSPGDKAWASHAAVPTL